MTERYVTVHLNAKVAGYLRGMEQSDKKTADVAQRLRDLDEQATHLTRGGLMASLAAVPGLLSPIGAGLVALPGLGLTAAASASVLALSMHGLGDAFQAANEGDPEKLAEALGKLSEAGREFILAYQRVKPTLDRFGDDVQQAFFLQFSGDDLERLVNAYLPSMLNQIPRLATAMGILANDFVDFATAPKTVHALNRQISLATELSDDWARTLNAGTEILLDLAVAGEDFNRGFVGGLATGTERLRDWVEQRIAVGDMNRLLDNGARVLAKLGDVAAEAGELLFDAMANPALADATNAFLEMARIALQVVHGLVGAFSALPQPVQSVAGTLLAVGGAAMLLAGRFAVMKAAGLAAIQQLHAVGPAGAVAAAGLERGARWAARLTLAFAALQAGAAIMGTSVNPQIDSLAEGLARFGEHGVVAGETARIFGDDLYFLQTALAALDEGFWTDVQVGIASVVEGFTGLGTVMDDSLQKGRERLQAVDQALVDLVRQGRADEAGAAFRRISAEAEKFGVSTDELRQGLPGYVAAVDELARVTDDTAQAEARAASNADLMTRGMRNAIAAGRTLTDVFEELNGTALSWAEAENRLEDAFDDAADTIEENGKTLDVHSEKGRANRDALIEISRATQGAIQAKYDETRSLEEANHVYELGRIKLIESAMQAGATRVEAEKLAAQWLKMPTVVGTQVVTPGLDTAISRAQQLQRELNKLIGKTTVRIGIEGQWGGGFVERWGGITVHAREGVLRQAMVATPQSPARYAWAEPATGGEAFVPKRGDYGRSMSILSEAAGWYGASVVPGGMSGGVQTVVHEHRHTIEITGREMWSGFRRQIDRLGGNVQAAAGRKPS